MRVLFASTTPLASTGGAEQTVVEWANGLRARGHGVETVSLSPEPEPAPERYWRRRAEQRARLGVLVEAAIEHERPDVVVSQLHGAPAALAAAADAGIPGVLVVPSYESLCKLAFDLGSDCPPDGDCVSCPAARRLAPAEREALAAGRAEHDRALAHAAAVLALSECVANVVHRRAGRTANVVHPVGPRLPEPARPSRLGPVVCAAARWGAHKGAALLPALVTASRAVEARIVVVTEIGLAPRDRQAIEAAGGTVVPTAPIDELLHRASLVLVPSQWDEPFGRIAWQTLARGIPVLASDCGGLSEFVPAELRVTPRGDPEAWTRAIDRLLGDRGVWAEAAAAARPAAAKLLDPPPLERLEQLLDDVKP